MTEKTNTRLFRTLRPDEIEVRIGQFSKPDAKRPWANLLLYKDARADMNVLDETVGPFNWQRKHYELKNVIYCSVGIRFIEKDHNTGEHKGEFIWKDDAGTESNTEAQKGESSDSFKRACVNWGIGRELYTSPRIVIFEDLDVIKKRAFYVKDIEYSSDGNSITKVVLGDLRNPNWEQVFK